MHTKYTISALLFLGLAFLLSGCAPVTPAYQGTPEIPVVMLLSESFTEGERPAAEEKTRQIIARISAFYGKEFEIGFHIVGSIRFVKLKTIGGEVVLEDAMRLAEKIAKETPAAITAIFTKEELDLAAIVDEEKNICGNSSKAFRKRTDAAAIIVNLNDGNPTFCTAHEIGHVLEAEHTTKKHTIMSEDMVAIPAAWHFDDANKNRIQKYLNRRFQ